jgi:hypothetical protein
MGRIRSRLKRDVRRQARMGQSQDPRVKIRALRKLKNAEV